MGAERKFLTTLTLPYESIRTLHEGSSEVRLYRNELIGQHQIGKRYSKLGLESTVAVNEGKLLKQIRHSHVVPVEDVVTPSGYDPILSTVELIMPFYERGSLTDAFERGERFTVGTAISLMCGALLGLAEIHDCFGVIHRDMKSPNLFLSDEGRLLVGDLGAAILMDEEGGGEALPFVQLYSAPESLITRRCDRRSDLFQMGLILHELTSGPFPYADPTYEIEAMAERLSQGRRAVRPVHLRAEPWVPSRLRRVINKAIQCDPARRFTSAKTMSDALANVPYIDWVEVSSEPDRRRWEGATVHRPDRRFSVEATQRKNAWSLVGRQQVTTWRRISERPDAIVSSLSDPQAASFFESMLAIATKR
ncbi:MAG TPA: protein kinase [Solirubrobacterales bacterium]|nr:protein kinase [Solirubrobacterales bacterium]